MPTKAKTTKPAEKLVTKAMPTVGQIVNYRASKEDADTANGRRSTVAQSHCGGHMKAGDVLPLMVTKINEKTFNGQLFLDGNDSHWVKGTTFGEAEGECF